MIGIKHEDKNKILDYCIRECIKKHDALLGIRANLIYEKSEQINAIDNSIIFTELLYYPTSDDDDVILSDYELQINDKLVVFYMHYILLNKNNEWSNAIIRTAQLDYDIAVLSRNMGYTQHNKLITISQRKEKII